MSVSEKLSFHEWTDVYKKLVYWEMQLDETSEDGMKEVLETQKADANRAFCKFVTQNYLSFLQNDNSGTLLSHNLFRKAVNPLLDAEEPVYVILLDNLRFDQWRAISETLNTVLRTDSEDLYMSILPTTTQYARNAIFSGMLPLDIEKTFPDKWSNDEDEGGKNLYEKEFLEEQLKRLRRDIKFSYHKITRLDHAKALVDNVNNMRNNQLNVIVYNFVDAFSHARTDVNIVL